MSSTTVLRRLGLTLIVLLCTFGIVSPAVAKRGSTPAGSHAHGASLLDWQERWFAWVGGSASNPFETGSCGERVGKLFFLTASLGPGTEVECRVPTGVPLLASPGGTLAWAPDDSASDEQLLAERDAGMVGVGSPVATLDGRSLDVGDSLRLSGVYTVPLEPGNFIQDVDPGVVGDEVRLASGGWFLRLNPLTPGRHELVLSDEVDGTVLDITFHLAVGRR